MPNAQQPYGATHTDAQQPYGATPSDATSFPAPDARIRGIVVSHTHWDRAWYLPYQAFRVRLVRLIDRLLDLLDADPGYASFTLDGQTVLLEDYVEVRPDQADRLRARIADGRLRIGPFYVLPDLFLASMESHVRNLQRGLSDMQAWGVPDDQRRVGYVPDPFGHPAQMPQLLRGFGVDTYVLTRGLSRADKAAHGNLFAWQAPDGSQVTAFYGRDGYFNAGGLGLPSMYGRMDGAHADVGKAAEQLRTTQASLGPNQGARTLLLLNGFDHMPEQASLPAVLTGLRAAHPDWSLEHAGLDAFFDAVDGEGSRLPTRGETGIHADLIGNADHPILLSVYSTRLYLKRQLHATESLLLRVAEPMAAWMALTTPPRPSSGAWRPPAAPDARPHLDLAWREVLRCLPHDDICGCSVDAVHRDGEARMRHAGEITRTLVTEALEGAQHTGFAEPVRGAGEGTDLFVFNPHPWTERFRIEADVLLPNPDGEFGDPPPVQTLAAADSEGVVPLHVLSTEAPAFRSRYVESTWGRRYRIAADVDLPPLGYRVLRVFATTEATDSAASDPHPDPSLENDTWRLEHTKAGLSLTHKPSGTTRPDALRIAWEPDAGDSYSYSPPPDAPLPPPARYAHLADFALDPADDTRIIARWQLDVPAALDSDEWTRLDLHATLRLDHARGLHVSLRYHNTAKDGRLRLLVPTGSHTRTSTADAHWRLAERRRPDLLTPGDAPERYAGYPGELNYDTHHQGDFCWTEVDGVRTYVANRGLPEYALVDAGTPTDGWRGDALAGDDQTWIAVTLCRSVGWLSKKGGRIRRVGAGPQVPTPEAQCLREMGGDVLIGWAPDDQMDATTVRRACRAFSHPAHSEEVPLLPHLEPTGPPRPRQLSLLDIADERLELASFRPEPGGDGVALRLYNPTDDAVTSRVATALPLARCAPSDLNDVWDEQAAQPLDGGAFTVRLEPFACRTWVLRP